MIRDFTRRHTLLLCFEAVLIPLVILLILQFIWLGHLK